MNPSLLNPDRFNVVKGRKGSERGDLLDRFLWRLNPPREAAGYKPLTHGRLSHILQHVQTDELYGFLKECETASCGFSRCFWGRLKVKALPTKQQEHE